MKIADAHNDLLMSFNSNAEVLRYLNFCKNNGVVKLFTAYYFNQEQIIKDKSTVWEDIAYKFNLIGGCDFVVKTFENIGFVDGMKSLKRLIAVHPFCVTLTWNFENKLAGGAKSKAHLSKLGKRVVSELNKNNILVDVAHLNERSFWDVAEIQHELICSHTASHDIYSIPRNLYKTQLRLIGERGGFVGLSIYNTLLGSSGVSFETIRRHLDKFLEFAGENSVGFGTDFNSTGEQNPRGISLDYFGMQNLYQYLSNYYADEVLQKVFYQNLIAFENKIKASNSNSSQIKQKR